MMQIKFNFNNFARVCYGLDGASGIRCRHWWLWLAYPIMTSVHHVSYVSSVTLNVLRWLESLL